jgi:glycosyltransferase involved in cell wall biosynthesis
MAQQAQAFMRETPRYHWLGERPHWQVRRMLARCRLMVISSRMEGGANVISEALAADVPVIASRMSGNIGMLGADYAGYFPVGNEQALAELLYRAETSPEFYRQLELQCSKRKALVQPAGERAGLERLLATCVTGAPSLQTRAGKAS